ncbi:glutamyl- and glutaminyl-tRNA synthetase [Methylophaga aminisulfidivorans MP]|uniref:Glutamyl-Q tRNA(Asp) synthetase n=1 Tax=Methylophaga aminisulfidivorans MP TaxID=1026882 RepID=F5T1U9_9GAMM|nr:tRNA glutamyl-Q(34) synthetase GluQRS [Methylophaga aminisulfidivorans]EGL53240.1 glutamyl- and glutaminyl-tRNA synthetase [Methylophaga aminisulfidivorans MP]
MTDYIGRYAPSPTGPLHFGSLVTAVASYLEAKTQSGKWLLRMEDLDKPREMPGAADEILRTLESYGFEWDGEVVYQSQRSDLYQSYLDQLIDKQRVYPCNCSRREIADIAHAGIEGPIYPGSCRHGLSSHRQQIAWRLRVDSDRLVFSDRVYGNFQHHLKNDFGDFILKRADGLFAYQLAVVVDDAEQGITHVVRGADLLNSTSRQIYLQQQLGVSTPSYTHIPLVKNAQGEKLSKQTAAPAIKDKEAAAQLINALCFLGLDVTALSSAMPVSTLWQWALPHWQLSGVQKKIIQKNSEKS